MTHHPRTAGLTLIELIIATGLLVIGILSLFGLILTGQRASRLSTERTLARERLHGRIADLRAKLRDAGFTPADVVGLDGTADTSEPLLGAPATVRTIAFASASGINELAANVALGPLGVTNVDVNGDGDSSDTDVPMAEVKVVPVIVRITWRSGTWTPAVPDVPGGDSGQDSIIQLGVLLY